MAKMLLKVNYGSVVHGLRVRSQRAYAFANAAAERIAERSNSELIPTVYPGAVAKAIVAKAAPAQRDGKLYAVRFYKKNELWRYYEFGTPEHFEFAHLPPDALHFLWERLGEEVFLDHVDNPGYDGRHKLPSLGAILRFVARDEWTAAMARAMTTP